MSKQENSNRQKLTAQVHDYWNAQSCGTEFISEKKHSKVYFDAIEDFRYRTEPEIFSFAQFTRFSQKKVLEVGVGAGTDFVQWVRSGANAYGVDLTQEGIEHVKNRLALEGLNASELRVADAQALPFDDSSFDLTYSWGVIHHAPDTEKCLRELIRVTKPGGRIKIMIYNRHSLFALYRWLLASLFKGKMMSLKSVLYYHQESIGTKAYTRKELTKMLADLPVEIFLVDATVTQHDLLYYKSKPYRFLAQLVARIWGWQRCGWFLRCEMIKK